MLFYTLSPAMLLALYVLAAVLPALILMRIVWRMDRVEREPGRLLISLVFLGVLAALASIALERLGTNVLNRYLSPDAPFYTTAFAFLVVAVVEEGTKMAVLYLRTWRSPHFNFRFDGIVYAVFVSLGFAAFENILYVFDYGLQVAFLRAVLAIPAHLSFSVFMGLFYSHAKLSRRRGRILSSLGNLLLAYLSAVFLHGFYDACAMDGSVLSTLAFIAFIAVVDLNVIRILRRQSATDRPL